MADLRYKGMGQSGPPTSPASFHRSHVGSGTYNRFEALSPAPRVFTFGKRLLSDDKAEGSAPKVPRIDHNKIFDQLKEHDSSMETARAALTAANAVIVAHCKPDDGVLDSCKLPPPPPQHRRWRRQWLSFSLRTPRQVRTSSAPAKLPGSPSHSLQRRS